MNLLKLLRLAQERLNDGDQDFISKVETLTVLLRSAGVVPYKRSNLNNHVHQQFSSALVIAHEQHTTVDVTTRHQAYYHAFGYSTRIVCYLNEAVKKELLVTQPHLNPNKLFLSEVLLAYLSDDKQFAAALA